MQAVVTGGIKELINLTSLSVNHFSDPVAIHCSHVMSE
jgi:hypothetical protein